MATEDLSPRRLYRSRHPIGPDRETEMLRGFLTQGGGHLSKRAREKEFHALTDEEATQIEVLYNELFGDFGRKAV